MFDGVNVTLPLFGTLPTDFTSNDIDQISIVKGGAKADDLQPLRRLHHRLGQQVGDQRLPRSSRATSSRTPAGRASARRSPPYSRRIASGTRPTSAGRCCATGCTSTPPSSIPSSSSKTAPTPTARLPTREDERDELFGKLSWSVTDNVLVNVSHRETDREITGRVGVDVPVTASTSLGDESQLAVDHRRGLVDHQPAQLRDLEVHRLRARHRRAPGQPHRLPDPASTAACGSTSPTSTSRASSRCPLPIPGQTGFNTFIVPLINRYGFRAERRARRAAAGWASGRRSSTTISSARASRAATTSCSGRTSPTSSTSATSGTATRRTWRASPTAGARSASAAAGPRAAAPPARPCRPAPSTSPGSTSRRWRPPAAGAWCR